MGVTDRRSRARAAIQRFAGARGLPTDLTILSERWNTVVRLGDSDLIARCATLADLVRGNPVAAFQQEASVCRTLSERGAPVQVPIGEVVVVDGFPISLWHRVDGEMGEASEGAMVTSLARIHGLGSDIALDQSWFATIAEAIPQDIDQLNSHSVIEGDQAEVLCDFFERSMDAVIAANLPGGLVHGDAQRKNAIAMDDSAVWIDFEDCCIGPYAWDLACLTKNPNYPTERVLDTYADVSGTDRISSAIMFDLWALRDLEALTWMLQIKEERDSAFREGAQELLSQTLATASDG